uniref:glutathione transferase n=1 Tax=Leptobrachium leishanense TaxID=445787 RepID=A0A8C5MLA2_9ANUR
MCEKPMLYYFNGRGRAESIRWLLAAAGVPFLETFIDTREQYEKLLEDGCLLFQQIPMLEIDGMKLVQTRAILCYIAAKYNLYGKDLKDRAHIDMYVEGTADVMALVLTRPFLAENESQKQLELIKDRTMNRYYPVYEKALQDKDFLVGDQLSWADIHLLECILMVEELHDDILCQFPNLLDFKERISQVPTIKTFLQPGSPKKPIADANYVPTVLRVLHL